MSTRRAGLATVKSSIAWGVRAIARSVVDQLFPWSCTGCGTTSGSPFCTDCLRTVRWAGDPQCPCCGVPLASPPSHLCGRCLTEPPAFTRARALAHYRARDEADDPVGAAIRSLKYRGRRSLAGPLAALVGERFPYDPRDFDVIVPVPLHLARLRERGFNQALLLARGPARRFGIPLDAEALARLEPTVSQIGLSETERRRNVRDAISLRRGRSVAGKRVLLVDDVCTTTATADACARVLRRAGATSVDVLTVARTLLH